MEETSDAKRRRTEGSPAGFDDVEEEARAEEDVGEEEEPDWDAIEAKRLEEHERILRTRPTRLTHPILDAPEFRPTREEFLDPIAYLEQIREEAEAYGIIKVIPPDGWAPECGLDWESPKRFATKRQRIDRLQQSQPYDDGRKYTLKEYRRMANRFMDAWLTREERPVDIGTATDWGELYDDYWNIVDRGAMIGEEIEVEYGNDVDVHKYWTGFVKPDLKPEQLSVAAAAAAPYGSPEYYRRSGWNLNNIARWPGGLLKHVTVPIAGVTSPWLYLGMLFSTFSWHNEDNYLSSINYHHSGAPKQWFGVPGAKASAFESVVRRFFRSEKKEVPDVLHHMNTMFSPSKLKALGVPVYQILQQPGEFVVTYPQAFHGGFSYGFNCGEAVNFAAPHWVEHARLANERYRRIGRLAVMGHDRVMFTLARHVDEMDDVESIAQLRDEIRRLAHEDAILRPRLYRDGVKDLRAVVRPPRNDVDVFDKQASDYDDKRVCCVCKHTCFSSAVGCRCSQTRVCCLRHVAYMCRCPPSNKYLIEWEPEERHGAAIRAVEARLRTLGGALAEKPPIEPPREALLGAAPRPRPPMNPVSPPIGWK